MSEVVGSEGAAERLQSQLSQLPGFRAADLSTFPDGVTVNLEAAGARLLAAEAVRSLVRAETGEEPEVRVEMSPPAQSRTGRARFESVEVTSFEPGRVQVRAVLEWQRENFEGVAEGETSVAGELRACALATLRAVERVAGGTLPFMLIGIKELHVFDHDLVAVLVHSPKLPEHRLIGTSIIVTDRRRSAALAVLSATNRAIGLSVDSEEE